MKSLWRNRLARSAVNRKVGGSSPPRDELFFVEMVRDLRFLTYRLLEIGEGLKKKKQGKFKLSNFYF